jgi:hypothetical protein
MSKRSQLCGDYSQAAAHAVRLASTRLAFGNAKMATITRMVAVTYRRRRHEMCNDELSRTAKQRSTHPLGYGKSTGSH